MKFVALTTIIPFVVFSDILCAVSLRIASRAESKDDGKVSTMQEDTEDALLQGHLEVGKQRFTVRHTNRLVARALWHDKSYFISRRRKS